MSQLSVDVDIRAKPLNLVYYPGVFPSNKMYLLVVAIHFLDHQIFWII